MKLLMDANDFISIASTVVKPISGSIKSSTLIQKRGDNLHIKTSSITSLFSGVVKILESSDNKDFDFWIDGAQLKSILSVLPKMEGGSLFLSSSPKNTSIIIEMGKSNLKIPVVDDNTFPEEENVRKIMEVDATEFVHKINLVGKCITTDSMYQEQPYSCLLISTRKNEDQLVFAGNSFYAIFEQKIKANYSIFEEKEKTKEEKDIETVSGERNDDTTYLLKSNEVGLLTNSFQPNDVIQIVDTDRFFGYIDKNNTTCLVAKANMKPMEYEHYFDRMVEDYSIRINQNQLKYVIDSLSKLANEDTLKFVSRKKSFEVSNINNDNFIIEFEPIKFPKDVSFITKKVVFDKFIGALSDNFEIVFGNIEELRDGDTILFFVRLLDEEGQHIPTTRLTFVGELKNE